MRRLVIGQRLKVPNFSAFHWSPHGSLVSIGQNFLTTRVVHLPERTETSLTRTVRKSDYTPALVLPKHMAGVFDEKCREKEKYREEQIGECPFSIPRHNLSM